MFRSKKNYFKMFKILHRRSNYLIPCVNDTIKRFFLSNEYKCTKEWENRLKNEIFEKTDINNIFHQLDLKFQKLDLINILDIDILANKFNDAQRLNELEEVLYKLRLCPESVLMPERTSHAIIRLFMEKAPKTDLFAILGDKITFGMFPDYQLSNLLMDKFLTFNDPVSAVKIAVLQMLQEDFDNSIMKAMMIYSCYNYLSSSEVWEEPPKEEENEDEEPIKVRVKYLRNPYFDDHFDIRKPVHLIGKTLWLTGREIDDPIGLSSQLVGLVMYEKYDKCVELLNNVINSKSKLHVDAIKKAMKFASDSFKKEADAASSDSGESGESSKSDSASSEVENEEVVIQAKPEKEKFLKLLKEIDQVNFIKEDLLLESEKLLKKTIQKHEKEDIQHICKTYKKWEEDRQNHIKREIERERLKGVKQEIDNIKAKMAEEERKIFYFDNEYENQKKIDENIAKKKSVVFYKEKRKNKNQSEESYVPPPVHTRRGRNLI